MKRLIFILMSLWVLSSCSVSYEEQFSNVEEETNLAVFLATSSKSDTRAISTTIADEAEKELKSIDILVFNRQNNLLKKERFTGANITSPNGMVIKTNVGVCNLFVIANLPAGMLDKVATIEDLSKVKIGLASQFVLNNGMVMSGEIRGQQIVADGENRCVVSLQRVTAKVNLHWSINLPSPLNSNDLKVKRVFVLNNYAQSTLTGNIDNRLTVTERIHGKEGAVVPSSLEPSNYADYLGRLIENTSDVSFYLTENRNPTGNINSSNYSGTKIVIETVYSPNGQGTIYYYPIIINKLTEDAVTSSIQRNTAYQITANIKGLSGVLDPFDPVVNRNLEVKLEIVDWVSIDQTVDFN